jgi:membrane associated rhomboid family serine protease
MQTMYLQRKAQQARGYAGKSSMRTPFGKQRDARTAPIVHHHSSSEDNEIEEAEYTEMYAKSDKKYTRDLKRGLAAYRQVRVEERSKQRKPGWFGGTDNKRRGSVQNAGIDDDYRTEGKQAPERKHANVRDDTLVALQLEALPTYYPYFTYGITTIQTLIILGILTYAYTTGDMAKFGLIGKETSCSELADVSCPQSFEGELDKNYMIREEVNWSYGPNSNFLLMLGAKWSGCMRYSQDAQLEAAITRGGAANDTQAEGQCIVGTSANIPGYPCDDTQVALFPNKYGVACCETFSGGRKGMLTYNDCRDSFIKMINTSSLTAATKDGNFIIDKDELAEEYLNNFPFKTDESNLEPLGSKYWEQGKPCNNDVDNIILRPCCGIRMDTENFCEVITQSECTIKGGTWQDDALLCSDVMCFAPICKVLDTISESIDKSGNNFGIKVDPEFRNQPIAASGNLQWWRFLLPLFLHSGAISSLLILSLQVYAGKNIEIQAGFLRTFLIYFISGAGGNAISAIFSPKTVSMGADPAVYGFLGVMVVELFQAWPVIPRAWLQLLKLIGIIVFMLLIGTLPYIDNWSHIGGLLFGIVAGIVFLPYITFGKWDGRRKKIMLFICIPLLVVMLAGAFLTFYKIPNTNFCPKAVVNGKEVNTCGYFNCIQWHSEINCDEYY